MNMPQISAVFSMNAIQSVAQELETWEKFSLARQQVQYRNTKKKLETVPSL
jgi:hypothetical protein